MIHPRRYGFIRGRFIRARRYRGDFPASTMEKAIRLEFFGDEIERILEIDTVTGRGDCHARTLVFPATPRCSARSMLAASDEIKEVQKQIEFFKSQGKLLEAERIKQRTVYDMEMLRELGYCSGIENYSRYFDGRKPGDPPYTMLDFFPDDYLLFIDESHVMLPQVRAMYKGDYSRKDMLVQYGFRLPSAYDNRPLKFEEFTKRQGQTIYVSATPAEYERKLAGSVVEQIVRPTGLVDPEISRCPGMAGGTPAGEARATVAKGYRYDHHADQAHGRAADRLIHGIGAARQICNPTGDAGAHGDLSPGLRWANRRCGYQLCEKGLICPRWRYGDTDADKEGLRNETSPIQTIGRAARNAEGRVWMRIR